MKPVLLDLFCGAGGCTKGYQQAGFYVVGVDINPQPRYIGDEFIQADALEFMHANRRHFDAYHASPPCQAYSRTRQLRANEHPDLVDYVRELLRATGKHYVIENVPGAPLIDPVALTGTMFGLRTVRLRLFECNFEVPFVLAPPAAEKHAKMGRKPRPGEYVHVVGKFIGIDYCRDAMGIDWMVGFELSQAIPPAYTNFIGGYLMQALANRKQLLEAG